ncbi:flavodoxin [Paucilactobacillus hokkaidonensis JCM 18461]|uniref:Flavodoxin n=2 Tax=Paucilactobacillus hokkaidonensis TaxID=1193095 RepID=A0A0A1GW12_9LACO|nr:flavodoxin [Paucilactobacillus hokkaidonensis]BAP85209.1 flavodoxin [Paucilactobacillus hokkaidonensis JCM 18461]
MASALVVFATITGNNEDVADIVTEAFEDLNVDVEEVEITQADPSDFENVDICVVCPYTYDEGALPEEGLDFYEDLQEMDLAGKVYGVAGSGDTFYLDDFNVAVDKFAAAFDKSGATRGAEPVKIDLEPDTDDIKTLTTFVEALVAKANNAD